MKTLLHKTHADLIAATVRCLVEPSQSLPAWVFKPHLTHVAFWPLDELLQPTFTACLKHYLSTRGDQSFCLTTLKSRSASHLLESVDIYGAFQFSTSDQEGGYISPLNSTPLESPAQALAGDSNDLLIFSASQQWAIYADRNCDIAVCAFTSLESLDAFKTVCAPPADGRARSGCSYVRQRSRKCRQKSLSAELLVHGRISLQGMRCEA